MQVDYKSEISLGQILYFIGIIGSGVALYYGLVNRANENQQGIVHNRSQIIQNQKSISELKDLNRETGKELTRQLEKVEVRLQGNLNKMETDLDWLVKQKINEKKTD
ncbi:hypothetical protein [Endozoicomonas sp. ALB091]|uniref:hypothetical protein n=1 Tax=Endozoicomonas sp. ALB091 TaxID=3403073 RepID=UPI003BB67C38